jgi:hypothetical protein
MKAHEIQTKMDHQWEIKERNESRMKLLAGKLHHLVSTKAIDGVYNGVYTKNYKISNTRVDDFLKKNQKKRDQHEVNRNWPPATVDSSLHKNRLPAM